MLYFRNHRLAGLEDSLEIIYPMLTNQGTLATTLGDLEGVKISERVRGTMHFSLIKLHRSTAMSILFVWGLN